MVVVRLTKTKTFRLPFGALNGPILEGTAFPQPLVSGSASHHWSRHEVGGVPQSLPRFRLDFCTKNGLLWGNIYSYYSRIVIYYLILYTNIHVRIYVYIIYSRYV